MNDFEKCADCGLSLDAAHDQPAGYVRLVLADDGSDHEAAICGACDCIRRGWDQRGRKTAGELAEVEA